MTAPRTLANAWRSEIGSSIERTLLEQARRNEQMLAGVRAVTLSLVATGDWLTYAQPPAGIHAFPLSVPLITTSWSVGAIALAVALRAGHYHLALRWFLPACDGSLTGVALFNLALRLDPEAFATLGGLTTCALACAVLAATGALRLSVAAASTTAGMALAIYAGVAWVTSSANALTTVHLALLFGIGVLGVWMTGVVRRSMRSEVGRSALQRFLPSAVMEGAYGTDSALIDLVTEPRSVDATIVITDLRGFTSLAESLTPTESLAFLNTVQGRLAEVVRAHGGTVDKFLGDGMLAVFGAPEPMADHASRGLAAALAMLDGHPREGGVRLGVGVHSGPVVSGCLGSGSRLEFTVIGDAVNTASRLESLTKERAVDLLVSDETLQRVPDPTSILRGRPLVAIGEAPIRGRKTPLTLWGIRADAQTPEPPAAEPAGP